MVQGTFSKSPLSRSEAEETFSLSVHRMEVNAYIEMRCGNENVGMEGSCVFISAVEEAVFGAEKKKKISAVHSAIAK